MDRTEYKQVYLKGHEWGKFLIKEGYGPYETIIKTDGDETLFRNSINTVDSTMDFAPVQRGLREIQEHVSGIYFMTRRPADSLKKRINYSNLQLIAPPNGQELSDGSRLSNRVITLLGAQTGWFKYTRSGVEFVPDLENTRFLEPYKIDHTLIQAREILERGNIIRALIYPGKSGKEILYDSSVKTAEEALNLLAYYPVTDHFITGGYEYLEEILRSEGKTRPSQMVLEEYDSKTHKRIPRPDSDKTPDNVGKNFSSALIDQELLSNGKKISNKSQMGFGDDPVQDNFLRKTEIYPGVGFAGLVGKRNFDEYTGWGSVMNFKLSEPRAVGFFLECLAERLSKRRVFLSSQNK